MKFSGESKLVKVIYNIRAKMLASKLKMFQMSCNSNNFNQVEKIEKMT